MREIEAGGRRITVLEPGDDLERGGVVGDGEMGFRLSCGTEVTEAPQKLAELARQLHTAFGGEVLPCTDPQVLLVGGMSGGFTVYGPYPMDDPDGRAEARKMALGANGEGYEEVELLPLTELVPIDPDPVPTRQVAADVEVPGVGTLTAGTTYMLMARGGRVTEAFAVVGRELIGVEVADGEEPDFTEGTICDPVRGDEAFFYPAMALLRYANEGLQDEPYWHVLTRREFEGTLAGFTSARLIAGWVQDGVSGGYRVTVFDAELGTKELVLHTPTEVQAFIDGMNAVLSTKQVTAALGGVA
jgi:hypothetical protein